MAAIAFDPKEFYLDGYVDAEAVARNAHYAGLYVGVQSSPAESGPIFSGSFDWHSSVHSNLALISAFEAAGDDAGLAAYVERTFTPEGVQGEIARFQSDPYGWAWLLRLDQNLKDHGFDNLDPLANAFAPTLLSYASWFAPQSYTYGWHWDARWLLANLYSWGESSGRQDIADAAKNVFLQNEAVAPINASTPIDYGAAKNDFWSNLGLSAYSHVVMGVTDTAVFDTTYDRMLASASDGSLDKLIANTTADVVSGKVGFSHYPGILLTSAYGYWAMFEETGVVSFSRAYDRIVDFAETYAPELGVDIGSGHWLPSFATFAATLPMTMPAHKLEGVQTDGTGRDDFFLGDITTDSLAGGKGDDFLIGGANDDTLSGGDGDDSLYGDAGALPSAGVRMGISVQTVGQDSGNTTSATALDLTDRFSLDANPDIADSTVDPHTTVNATGSGEFAFYKVHVNAGAKLIVDIDGADKGGGAGTGFNSSIQVLDTLGNVIGENDDASGDAGSTGTGDSGLTIDVPVGDDYLIRVGSNAPGGVPTGATYTLNVSVEAMDAALIHQYAGDAGNDVLDAGAGNDTLHGGDGGDVLDGGADDDVLFGDAGSDRLIGADGNDSGRGGTGDDSLFGGDGTDSLYGEAGNDLVGGDSGDDQVFGQDGADSVQGGTGDDFASGGFGSDSVLGGFGNDLLFGDDDGDWVDGNDGDDRVYGGTGIDTVFGSLGTDQVYGEDGNDFVGTGAGNDFGSGGFGNDEVHGEAGDDLLFGDDGNDGVYGEDGDDLVYGGTGNDVLTGDAGSDRLLGQDGDDGLSGGAGADTLDGGAGADLLFGNAGDDRLTGGSGSDVFGFGRGDGRDVVADFVTGGAEADVIAFNGAVFADFAAVQAAIRQEGTDTVIAYGDGDTITLLNVQAGVLSAANFATV